MIRAWRLRMATLALHCGLTFAIGLAMTHRPTLFLLSLAAFVGFAALILGLVYLAIPPLDVIIGSTFREGGIHANEPSAVARALLGSPQQIVFSSAMLLMLASIFASFATSLYLRREKVSAGLREQLFRAYGNMQDAQDEARHLRGLLQQATEQITELANQLRQLESTAQAHGALDSGQYDTGTQGAENDPALLALQDVSDEIDQASESVRDIVPSAHSLEHSLVPLAARARAAAEALTALQTLVNRLSRLAFNAALEASRHQLRSDGFTQLAEEFKTLNRATSEQAAAVAEQVWHMKETLSSAASPLSHLVADANSTLTHLREAAELIDLQWNRLQHATHGRTPALAEEVAEAAEQARKLEARMHRALDLRDLRDAA